MQKKTDCADVFKARMTEEYFDTVYRLAFSRTGNRSHADDVTQEVFLRFLKTDKAFESEEHVKAWLIHVTVNCSKNVFSDTWFKRTVPLSEEITFSDPETGDVYMAVSKLPQKYRTVIHLFYYEDMPIRQIAECLNLKEATVKSQLHRGREMLKSLLDGRDIDEL